jgi:hypothetical protein
MTTITKADIKHAKMLLDADPVPPSESSLVPVLDARGEPTGEMISGGELLARLDVARLAEADLLARRAAQVRADARDPELGVEGHELAAALEWRDRAAALRETVASFAKDREDFRRGRGRWRPLSVHGPARAFASGVELSPTDYCVCSACGVRRGLDSEGTVHGKYRLSKRAPAQHCAGVFKREWSAPERSERFAVAAAREAGRRMAQESGSSVEYVDVRDASGTWLRTEARAEVGYELVLRAEEQLRPAKVPGPGGIVERGEARQIARAERAADVAWALRRTEARARLEDRKAGRKNHGKRGGRRGGR